MPPTTQHTAYNHLRMSTSHFKKNVIEVAVPPTTRRSAYNSLRMQTSHRLNKPMEYGRAADNTTFGVQVFALGARPCRRRHDIRHTITCGCQRRTS